MGDLGIPGFKLELYDGYLPNVASQKPKGEAFDVNATLMSKAMENNEQERPNNIEFVVDEASSFGVAFPSRKHVEITNYLEGFANTSATASKYVIWNVRTSDGMYATMTVGPGLSGLITNKTQVIKKVLDYNSDYQGPRWEEVSTPKSSATAQEQQTGQTGQAVQATQPEQAQEYYGSVRQTKTAPDTWWCIETHSLKQTDPNSYINIPFYIDISRKQPQAKDQKTFIMIRINPPEVVSVGEDAGKPDVDNSIDLLLIDGEKPKILDWNTGDPSNLAAGAVKKPAEFVMTEIEYDFSAPNSIRFGFLPVMGKLVIYLNDRHYLYSRIRPGVSATNTDQYGNVYDDGQNFVPFYVLPKVIRIVGSNCQADVNLSAMGFNDGTCSLLLPATKPLMGSADGKTFAPAQKGNLFKLPRMGGVNRDGGEAEFNVGVCCRLFYPPGGASFTQMPIDTKYWTPRGEIDIVERQSKNDRSVEDLGSQTHENSSNQNHTLYYAMNMFPKAELFGEDLGGVHNVLEGIGPPFFFRLRGGYRELPPPKPPKPVDATEYLMNFNETFGSSERCVTEHSLELTLYSPNGVLDDLLRRGMGVVLSTRTSGGTGGIEQLDGMINSGGLGGADDGYTPIFTGVSMGGSRTEVAGKETISIKCEDYMIVMKHTLMINSPFYDGMDLFNAVYDLAGRCGIEAVDDTPDDHRYYLPMGYSFTTPAKRFGATTNIQENIKEICAQSERVFYFDNNGKLHLEMLQGGLIFNSSADVHPAHYFYRDPAHSKNVILDEKRFESAISSTVNGLIIKTVDRNNNAVIIVGDDATNDQGYVPIVPYKKIILMQQPALGSYQAAVNQVNLMRERVYKPISHISFKVFNPDPVIPLSFMQVDGDNYRITSFGRSFSAEDNSHVGNFEGEWMGKLTTQQ